MKISEIRKNLTKYNSERLVKKYQSGDLNKTGQKVAGEILSRRGITL
jgi:hypothetical protein